MNIESSSGILGLTSPPLSFTYNSFSVLLNNVKINYNYVNNYDLIGLINNYFVSLETPQIYKYHVSTNMWSFNGISSDLVLFQLKFILQADFCNYLQNLYMSEQFDTIKTITIINYVRGPNILNIIDQLKLINYVP